ncbi:MAG: NAD(P)-binding domain-containing protein [Acidimicrobiales bacterium]
MREVNTVVVGAGQAGLSVSYLLTEAGLSHLVFEKGRIGESWRSQRWDSFALNTPNWANLLPGAELGDEDPDAFDLRDGLVETLEQYAAGFDAPIEAETPVTRAARDEAGFFHVETPTGAVRALNLVVCSGSMSTPNMPAMADALPDSILNLSAATYKSSTQLPSGAVLVVGSGQSGCQVAEDLLESGRVVYLCTSKVGRIPRTYRGRDIVSWLNEMGVYNQPVEALDDPDEQYAAQPQVSGADGGHTVSLQSLARDGATLLGRISAIQGTTIKLATNLHDCVDFADRKCAEIKAGVDAYISTNHIAAPAATPDPYEPPLPDLGGSDELEQLDLADVGVSAVVWCVGFHGDFSWIEHDVIGERGIPKHTRGVSDIPGLYFVGFPWLSRRKSGILLGVGQDAAHVVDHIASSD